MTALQAFEASARLLSFAEAGRDCCLTPGAISRQVRLLEADLGVALFRRDRGGLVLTTAGEALLPEVRGALDRLAQARDRVAQRGTGPRRLAIATLPAFGARWLMPRYRSFAEAHPDIAVTFFTCTEAVSFDDGAIDAAIHYGPAPPAGTRGDWIMDERPTPVCAPALHHPAGLSPARALEHYRLLQHVRRPAAWADWLARLGDRSVMAERGPAFEQLHLMAEAALSGLGLALLPEFMVQDDLATGRLVAPFSESVNTGWGYWFVYPGNRPIREPLQAFRHWLLLRAAATMAGGLNRLGFPETTDLERRGQAQGESSTISG